MAFSPSLIQELRKELQRAQAEYKELERRGEELVEIIDALESLVGKPEPKKEGERQTVDAQESHGTPAGSEHRVASLPERILDALQGAGRSMRAAQIAELLRARGENGREFKNSRISAELARLHKRGVVRRVGRGSYRLAAVRQGQG